MKTRVMIVALVAFAGGPADAEPVEVSPGQTRCFERSYGRAHLRKHPGQTVREVRLELSRREASPDYALTVRWRGDDVWYSNFGVFTAEPAVTRHHASEGTADSGSGTFVTTGKRASLTIEIDGRVTLIAPCDPGSCEDAAERTLDAGNSEHRIFRLREVRCPAGGGP